MSTREQLKLRGPVHTLRSEFAEWDRSGEQWKVPRRSALSTFRPDGKISETEEMHPNGISHSRYLYDEVGRLLETTFRLGDGPVSKTSYNYDGLGRLVQEIVFDSDGTAWQMEAYHYDERGRKTKVQFVQRVAACALQDGNRRDSCGTMYGVEGTEQGFGAEDVTTITTLYDDREQPAEALFRDKDGALTLRVVLSRDSVGNLIRVHSQCGSQPPFRMAEALERMPAEERAATAAAFAQLFSPQSTLSSASYQYDDHGRRIRRDMSMGALSHDWTVWEYDQQDNPILETTENNSWELQADESGKLQPVNQKSSRWECRHEYRYDAFGNWTEHVVAARYELNSEFQPSNIERREITYYS